MSSLVRNVAQFQWLFHQSAWHTNLLQFQPDGLDVKDNLPTEMIFVIE